MMDDPLLISYFSGDLCAQDKRLLNVSSGGSLVKYKTADKAWKLINDVAKSTQHARVKNNPPKSVAEVSSSDSTFTKVLGEMTTLLTEIHQGQKSSSSIQAIEAPHQILQIEGPPRMCGVCSCTSHYTDQCPQIQGDYTLVVTKPYNNCSSYHPQNQVNYSHGNNYNQGWQDNSQGNNYNQRWNQGPTNLLLNTKIITNFLLNHYSTTTHTKAIKITKANPTTKDINRPIKDNKFLPINLLLPQSNHLLKNLFVYSSKNKKESNLW
ncbi:hypothetical protein AHAS_Ahas09G0081000 [Arachis hypogaea]